MWKSLSSWPLRAVLGSLVSGALAACAGLGGPHVITLTQSDLARLLDGHFPLERRLLDVFDVRLTQPILKLMPERNRLAAEISVGVSDRIFGKQWQVHAALDGALRFNEADNSVQLTQVHVGKLQADPDAPARQIDRLMAQVAERMLDGMAIYRFNEDDLRKAKNWGVKPGAVTVTSRGVEITLAPVGS